MSADPNNHPQFASHEAAPGRPPAPPPGAPAQPSPTEVAQGEVAQGDNVKEIGGPKGPEPTRYGDWEVGGRCTDF